MTEVIKVSGDTWNLEYGKGKWTYLEKDPGEQSRNAIIAIYCKQFAVDGKLLDVGCGTGSLCDFLLDKQKENYLGIDISAEAIRLANLKRNLTYIIESAETFQSDEKFDIIIFNEVLYYVDYKKALKRFSEFLAANGTIIISVYKNPAISESLEKIWNVTDSMFETMEHTILCKKSNSGALWWDIKALKKKEY